jgi:hypothetical protein
MNCLTCFELTTALLPAPAAFAQSAPPQVGPTLHRALFLVGDSIMKTGDGNGERGPWGNLGGRSSQAAAQLNAAALVEGLKSLQQV